MLQVAPRGEQFLGTCRKPSCVLSLLRSRSSSLIRVGSLAFNSAALPSTRERGNKCPLWYLPLLAEGLLAMNSLAKMFGLAVI